MASAIARALAFLLLFIVCEAGLGMAARLVLPSVSRSLDSLTLQVALQLVAVVAATAIMLRSIDVRPLGDVGLDRAAARTRPLLEGALLGGSTIGLACGLLIAAGELRVVAGPAGSSLASALPLTAFLVVAALTEELLLRGYLLTALADGIGMRWAVVATSLMFGALHIWNAGATVESILIVTLAGLFLGAIRVAFRSVYAASAAHLAWNWMLAVALHAFVSGIRFDAPDYRTVDGGPDWLTGGAWGPEGGAAAAAAMLVGLAYLHRTRRRRGES
ncbi:MAG TPA: type II CAAX endopeptidase family protein [Gemmatimonadaceae bacterium]|nr:type II CAAX endopeptidase family protein [Gemmatimonadaceae bacterium]